jgi:hypothetical protein
MTTPDDATPASGQLRREQIDALLEELRDPALARQFLMDAGLIDADGQLTPPYRSQDEVPGRSMEPGSEVRWEVENVALQLSELPCRRSPSPATQNVKNVVEWLQTESGEASYEGRVSMAERLACAAILVQEQEARIAELEAQNVELGRVGW